MTRVLSVASECVPLIKTGGLADVTGALPGALAQIGVEVRTLLPGYRAVMGAVAGRGKAVATVDDLFGGPAEVLEARLGKQVLYVLSAPHLFDRPGAIYLGPDGKDWPDNPLRFAALSKMAALIAGGAIEDWRPQVLHLHDWQAGLTPLYLRNLGLEDRVGTVLTIHNIAFQGLAPAKLLPRLDLPKQGFTIDGYEFYGKISALKAGLVYSDKLSTVSPTYAVELLTPEFGMGLDGVLRKRRADLVGILNGIDLDVWQPPYKTPRGKARHTAALRRKMKLPDASGPLCVIVSRLTEQKGLDMLLDALPFLLNNGGQLAVLGTGDAKIEKAFEELALKYEDVAVHIGYDEAFSRQLIAGGDVILVPSRFEPCGLTQLYGLRYGTLPLVALTGGLADTVISANPAALASGVATGFQFSPVTSEALEATIVTMLNVFEDRELWARLQQNAMRQKVGWEVSAVEYAALFESVVKQA